MQCKDGTSVFSMKFKGANGDGKLQQWTLFPYLLTSTDIDLLGGHMITGTRLQDFFFNPAFFTLEAIHIIVVMMREHCTPSG